MEIQLDTQELIKLGLDATLASVFVKELHCDLEKCQSAEQAWQKISPIVIHYNFQIQLYLFDRLFPQWREHPETAAAWMPNPSVANATNIGQWLHDLNFATVEELQGWTIENYSSFWERVIKVLNIQLDSLPNAICDLSQSIESPQWLPGATMNIVNSCFIAPPEKIALIYEDDAQQLQQLSYGELNLLVNRISHSLLHQGLKSGDAIAIIMPMNYLAVAIYLAIIRMGGYVVSIADSFSSEEIATRLKISNAKAIFTQDFSSWGTKQLPLYSKVEKSNVKHIIVVTTTPQFDKSISAHHLSWENFLLKKNDPINTMCSPMTPCNILFSSGTTGTPKAIIWNHTTPIKAASDAYFHHNVQSQDVLAWPTNLGWMMGPWLIFASFINQATIALTSRSPKERGYGEFIQNAQVTMLGVVPTLVAGWRQSKCMEGLNWSQIKAFSSTGECSNPEDMLYLMSLAGYKPIIEYCGGTEIGGAYLSSTLLQVNRPALFSTPTMGMNVIIIDEHGQPSDTGEIALIPPSMGLSTELLNANHHQVYFEKMPHFHQKPLRRHGDLARRYANGYYTVLGRVDDTMNLGGIKTSAAEIERALIGCCPEVLELAAISASPPHNGPSQLIIYAATNKELEKTIIKEKLQKRLNDQLNPLFKIADIVFIKELPKTASNKIMRRLLRDRYQALT